MSDEQRVINRDYLLSKSLIYIGDLSIDSKLIEIFQKAFQHFKTVTTIEDLKQSLDQFDVIVCNESDHSHSYLKEIRTLDNKNIPFILIENEKYNTNPIIYIKDNLSQYIKLTLSHTEIMYIIQHELQNYDNHLENIYLQEEHQAYLEMLDNIVIVSRTDLKGVITYANDVFCEVSKYSKEELIGSPHNIVRDPENSSTIFQELWNTIQAGKIWKGILKNKDKEGETYITNTTIAPYYTHGEKKGYIGIRYLVTGDVTEKRNLKNHLRKTIIDTKEIIKQKDQDIKELKNKNKMVDLIEKALEIEKSKKEQVEKQLVKFEKEIKDAADEHSKRVESYLQERREYADVLQKKDREIAQLKKHLQSFQTKNDEYETSMLESGNETILLKKRIKELEDIVQHQEEKLIR